LTSVEAAQKFNQHIQLATRNQIRGGHEFLFALKPWNHLMVGNGGGIGNLLPEPVGGTASSALSSEIGTHFTRQVQFSGLQAFHRLSIAALRLATQDNHLSKALR